MSNKKLATYTYPQIKEIIRHTEGEIQMFYWCHKKLNKPENLDGSSRRAIHECYLLHARNISDFLFYKKDSDDVSAKDFGVDIDEPEEEFKKIHKRINKQLSHITYSRLNNIDLLSKTEYIFDVLKRALFEYSRKALKEYNLKIPTD